MRLSPQHFVSIGLLLSGVAGMFAALHNWQEATSPAFIGGLLALIGSTLTGMFSRNPNTTPGKSLPKSAGKFSVGKMPPAVLLCLTLGLAACGGNVAPRLVAAEDAVHDALASAHDRVEAICTPGVLVETCQPLNGTMADALRSGRAFSATVASERLGGLSPLVEAIGRAIGHIAALPQNDLRERLLADLRAALSAAFQGVQ